MNSKDADLTKQFIEEVRHASDIVQVVGRHVNLRKRGANHLGLCPFHKEKTPSFTVSAAKHMYYCFGCGASGDVFTFLQELEGMNFPEAVIELAKAAGLTVPQKTRESKQQLAVRQQLLDACAAAADYFHKQLTTEGGTAVRTYLQERGIGGDMVESYLIGYAPDGYENLLNNLKPSFKPAILQQAGLIQESQQGRGHYDRFRNRIIIPIRNTSGEVIAFGGRIFGEGEPKYLNSPETALFHKSRVLFGLYEGYRAMRKKGYAILVEGYFDAIMLHQNGFINTVAPLGTAFGEGHARILNRYCSKAVIAMDSDSAGKTAAVKAASTLLKAGFAVNILNLPEGEDPDSFINDHGKEAFAQLLRKSSSVIRFATLRCKEAFDTSRADGKRQALESLSPLLTSYSDALQRSEAITTVTNELDIPEHTVVAAARSQRTDNDGEESSKPQLAVLPLYEAELLRGAINNPQESEKAVAELDIIEYLSLFTRNLLSKIWEQNRTIGSINHRDLVSAARDDAEKQFITQLVISDDEDFISPEECARGIAIDQLKKEVRQLNQRIAALEQQQNSSDSFETLYEEKLEITARILSLEEAEGS